MDYAKMYHRYVDTGYFANGEDHVKKLYERVRVLANRHGATDPEVADHMYMASHARVCARVCGDRTK